MTGIGIVGLVVLGFFALQPREPSVTARGAVTLAVLPFVLLADTADSAVLQLGLPDAIISGLGAIGSLRVRPTTAILEYLKEPEPARAGKELVVDQVVTGTVLGAGDRLRIGVQLVRVEDGTVSWAHEYDLPRARLVELQDSVVTEIVRALDLKVTSAERERLYRRYTQDVEAWTAYQRGRILLVRQNEPDTRRAIEEFQAALGRHPNYAPAHAGLATASAQMRIRFAPEPQVQHWTELAKAEARRALALDSALAEAHEALAAVYRYSEFDWVGTIAQSTHALELNPSLDLPYYYRAAAYAHLGFFDLAEADARNGMARNPNSGSEPHRLLGAIALWRGDAGTARHEFQEVQRLSARPVSDFYLALSLYYAGDSSGAEAMLTGLRGSAQAERRAQATLASFMAARGARAGADSLVERATRGTYMDHHVAYALGVAQAQMGRWSVAATWLNRAWESGFPCLPWFRNDPLLAAFRQRPEYAELLRQHEPRWQAWRHHHHSMVPP